MYPFKRALTFALLALLLCLRGAESHDLANQIVIRAFVKPEGERLHVLLRLPLELLLNLNLPKQGPGYLDLARIDEPLQGGCGGDGR